MPDLSGQALRGLGPRGPGRQGPPDGATDPGRDRRPRSADGRRAHGLLTSRPLVRAVVAEAIGTFALVFAGAGAVMVDAKTHALGHVGVALTFGLVLMPMIYAVGHIS